MTKDGHVLRRALAVGAVGILLLTLLFPRLINFGVITYERTLLSAAPSAERAFAYGTRHLDRTYAFLYDIQAAERFYQKAHELDPAYPYVRHQLARIAFLQGDFLTAIEEIDAEIERFGEEHPRSYYIRGLIRGYQGEYDKAATDYEVYLRHDSYNWAAINDYAWVLLKGERFAEAEAAIRARLDQFPQNPWLHNSLAIAEYEQGDLAAAKEAIDIAATYVEELSVSEWSVAYPGNDPAIAADGLATFKKAVRDNMNMIDAAMVSSTLQSQ